MCGNNKGGAECPPGRLLCLRWDSYCFQALIIVIIVIIIYCDHCHYCFQAIIIVIIVIVVTIVIIVLIVIIVITVIVISFSALSLPSSTSSFWRPSEKQGKPNIKNFHPDKSKKFLKVDHGNKSSLVRSAPGGQQHSPLRNRILRNPRSSSIQTLCT